MSKRMIGVGEFTKEDVDAVLASTKNPAKAISEMAKLAGISYWEMKDRIAAERQRKYEEALAKNPVKFDTTGHQDGTEGTTENKDIYRD